MKLPWRKEPDLLGKNPWDDEVGLSGWVPGTNWQIDQMAWMTSLARSQWSLAQWLESVSRAQTRLSRSLMFCGFCWVLVALANLNFTFHWW